MKKNKFLFEEFSPVSAKEWKQKIQFDLKGNEYATLITKTLEGIDIKPFYHRDTFVRLPYSYQPGKFKILHEYAQPPSEKDIEFSFKQDVDKVRFIANSKPNVELLSTHSNVEPELRFADKDFMHLLEEKNIGYVFDPLSHLLRSGNWFYNEEKDMALIGEIHKNSSFSLEIDLSIVQNAGANIVQQIAYGLAHGHYYLERFGKRILPAIRFKFAIGYNYFFEIAKFKAFRYLWKLISEHDAEPLIYAVPSLRNKTLFDPYVNMLRTGMEMMAAVLGGADEIANYPYNYIYKKHDSNAMRLASNQLILLKEEAKFNRMLLAPEGSYYLEEIAVRLAEKSLDLFKQIEKAGGYTKQLYEGVIQRKIHENALKEQKLFDEGKLVLTGTNKFVNPDEKVPGYDKNIYLPGKKYEKTLIKKIIPKRLSEKIEKNRIQNLHKT